MTTDAVQRITAPHPPRPSTEPPRPVISHFRIEDPDSHVAYVLVRAEVYERLHSLSESEELDPSFFEIDDLDIIPQYYDAGKPVFRGVFEDNDPGKRLMMIVNFNTDISEFWEFSDTGLKPIDESNEAYKLGVNYVVYGMLH